jgi:hypothetical protein
MSQHMGSVRFSMMRLLLVADRRSSGAPLSFLLVKLGLRPGERKSSPLAIFAQ